MLTSISRLTGPIALTIAVSAVVATPPAAAQDDEGLPFPEGWEVRFDREGSSMDNLYLVAMPPGLHVTTGPAVIAWPPGFRRPAGDFRIESETFLFDPEGRREAFGFFVGGTDLQGQDQRYTYFLLREGGEFLVKTRSGCRHGRGPGLDGPTRRSFRLPPSRRTPARRRMSSPWRRQATNCASS